jgi:hypothetical protein
MRAIGATLPEIAAPVLAKQGLGKEGIGGARLLSEWPSIVGETLAKASWPMKLSFPRGERREGTLRLRVLPALALEIQHREPVLLERINGYFGYNAVARIAIVQGPPPLPDQPQPPVLRPLAPEERRALDVRLDDITDPALRAALDRLGSAIIGQK